MPWTASRVSLQKKRGAWEVNAIGRTPRGVKYRIASEPIKAAHITDPMFKGELAAAVAKLNVSEEPELPFPPDIDN